MGADQTSTSDLSSALLWASTEVASADLVRVQSQALAAPLKAKTAIIATITEPPTKARFVPFTPGVSRKSGDTSDDLGLGGGDVAGTVSVHPLDGLY